MSIQKGIKMLKIEIPAQEKWDKEKKEFYTTKPMLLTLEHSLISVSKWEEKWHKPFLRKERRTAAEVLDYIRCMVIQPQDVTTEDIMLIPKEGMEEINKYIEDPATATKIDPKVKKLMSRGQPKVNTDLTSELIYYYMAEFRLPADYQKWRLPRLLTLIETCQVKEWEKDPKHQKMLGNRMRTSDVAKMYHDINAKRRAALGSKG